MIINLDIQIPDVDVDSNTVSIVFTKLSTLYGEENIKINNMIEITNSVNRIINNKPHIDKTKNI